MNQIESSLLSYLLSGTNKPCLVPYVVAMFLLLQFSA